MRRQRLILSVLAAGLVVLAPRPAAAQLSGEGPSQMTVGRSYHASTGAGYAAYYPSANLASRYGFYPGYYTGDYRPTRFASSEGYWATLSPGYTPIFMTTLNYPGVYGSYTTGLGGASSNVMTAFQTRPDNVPSDNPVGVSYAPLQRRMDEVPFQRRTELTTRTELTSRAVLPAKPALIDVTLPADATLSFQGVTMTERGTQREFQSPPLEPGRNYSYDLRATWKAKDGQEVVRTRHITVRAGDRQAVDLNRELLPPTDESEMERPTLRTQPLPSLQQVRPPSRD